MEPSEVWTRERLGLPEDALVFVTAANYFKIIPEMQHAWAKLLAAVPGSRLLVHPFNPNWSSKYPIARFCAEFDHVLAEHGVAGERLLVSTEKFPSRSDVKELLSVGDIYLDSFPFGGVNSLIDPLELGIPVIAWEGQTFRARMGSSLLRAIGVDELVAADEAGYLAIATALANDLGRRQEIAARIREAMERSPVFLDTLSYSDACGDLLEAAYDQLFMLGRATFRKDRTPLVAAETISAVTTGGAVADARLGLRAQPADPAARRALGNALLAEEKPARAVEYLLAAVQHDERNGALWFELSNALRRNGQSNQALEALEACLRVDETNVEAWFTFAQLARECGNLDLAKQAAEIAQKLAPDDARLNVLMA
jgi:predicted O-linked N-acetylglucosamine transferase (SPINDLY family)